MTTPNWRRALAVLAATVVASTMGAGLAGAEDGPQVTVEGTNSANAIADQYIVVMRAGASAQANRVAAAEEARNNGGQILNEYGAALQGFT